ncbi:MAG: lysophospholipid acyltransferase family protein [Actinomycetota bacterium]
MRLLRTLKYITEPPATPKGVERRPEPPRTGVYYDTDWAHRPVAKFVRRVGVWGFFKPAVRIYGSPRVIGTDRLEHLDGPLIFAANHHSHADTSLLLATLPAHLRDNLAIAAGADYFFPNRVSAALSALFIGAIPIERQKLSKLSIDNSLRALKDRGNLLIFPEGGRSPDGWSRKHRPGAAFLARRSGAPVVPVYLDGTGTILPKGKNWPTRSRCAVVFGDPLTMGDEEDTRAFAERIEHRIAELADEFSSGWWQARKNAYRRNTPDATGPDAGAWRRRWALGSKPRATRAAKRRSWPDL